MGGVQDTYLRYEAAGDYYVDRTVSGLPSGTPDFAILPPFFLKKDAVYNEVFRSTFTNIPISLSRVAEFGMASVVYHSTYLLSTLSLEHPLRRSYLFRNLDLLGKLLSCVVCRRAKSGEAFTATGVPHTVHHSLKILEVLDEVKCIVPKLDSLPKDLSVRSSRPQWRTCRSCYS